MCIYVYIVAESGGRRQRGGLESGLGRAVLLLPLLFTRTVRPIHGQYYIYNITTNNNIMNVFIIDGVGRGVRILTHLYNIYINSLLNT